MVRRRREHVLVRFNRVAKLVLLDVALGAIQLFDDIHAHEGSNGFLCKIASADMRTERIQTKNTIYCPTCTRQTVPTVLLPFSHSGCVGESCGRLADSFRGDASCGTL